MKSLSDSSDEFFRQNQPFLRMAEEQRRLREALGPSLQLQREAQALREAMEGTNRVVREAYEAARLAADHRAAIDAFGRVPPLDRLSALGILGEHERNIMGLLPSASMSASLRIQDDALSYKALIDSITSIPSADMRAALGLTDTLGRLNFGGTLSSLAALTPAIGALQELRIGEDFRRWAQEDQARKQILSAAAFAVRNALASGVAAVNAEELSVAFSDAIRADESESDAERTTDLLAFAVSLALAISSQIKDADPKIILNWFVFPLLWTLVGVGLSDFVSSEANERLAVRIETAISREHSPKRFEAIKTLNVREAASRDAAILARIPSGTEVEELDRDARNWRYIRTLGSERVEGWVYFRNLRPK